MHRFTPSFPLLLLPLLSIFTSCEEALTDTEVRIPYVEEIVVQGFLTHGSDADTIRVSRTIPPLETWNAERAEVTDADVVISAGGVEHPLRHTEHGRYVLEGMVKEPGGAYELRVTSGDLTVKARATIPGTRPIWDLSIDTIANGCSFGSPTLSNDFLLISSKLFVERTLVYSIVHVEAVRRNDSLIEHYELRHWIYEPEDSSGELYTFSTVFCLDTMPASSLVDSIYSTLHTYEPGFSRFYETRFDGGDIDLTFGGSMEGPHWNVRGDGFGWFFGRRVDYDTLVIGG